jgi:hypothetical protein
MNYKVVMVLSKKSIKDMAKKGIGHSNLLKLLENKK